MSRTITGIVKNRYDTAANLQTLNPVLLEGQICIESDTNKIKVGDGTTAWNSLAYSTGEVDIDISDVNGLQDALDNKLESPIAISDVTDLQDSLDNTALTPERSLYLSNYQGDMQSAIDALATDGGVLYIDEDTDITTEAPIQLKSNVHLIGIGKPTIACGSASYAFEGGTALSNIRLENIYFTGFQQLASNGFLRIYNVNNQKNNIVLRNIEIFNCDAIAISIVKCDDLILENVVASDILRDYGINLEYCNRAHLLNCRTSSCDTYGLRMLTCQQSSVVQFDSTSDNIGIYLDTNTHNNTFIGTKVNGSTGNAIHDQGRWNTYIECKTYNTGGSYAINDQNGVGIVWINCDFDAYIYSHSTSENPPNSNVATLNQLSQYFNDFGLEIITNYHTGTTLTNPVNGSTIQENPGVGF